MQLKLCLADAQKRSLNLTCDVAEQLRKNEHLKKQFTAKIMAEIAEAQAAIADLSRTTMTLEEARVRLKQLQARLTSDDVPTPLFA